MNPPFITESLLPQLPVGGPLLQVSHLLRGQHRGDRIKFDGHGLGWVVGHWKWFNYMNDVQINKLTQSVFWMFDGFGSDRWIQQAQLNATESGKFFCVQRGQEMNVSEKY
ncbi:hypothetical protein [Hydrogenophaga sp.]|uniref:hypothetical protein n=2 Tax=Hydrogenophaga sp. TaxID=1904254 RepID=UPI0025B88B1F|nr:hypothetical protein [Hydrogenophaga sp.]